MTLDLEIVVEEARRNLCAGDGRIRLFHGRGQCFANFEDLAIDFYPPVLILGAYREGYPLAALAEKVVSLCEAHGHTVTCSLAQHRYDRQQMWHLLSGDLPTDPIAREDGLEYGLTLMKRQNIDFFPDMRKGRQLVAQLAPGKRVLNLFAYTCSFSVVAMHAGAQSCLNMDLSKAALSVGRANHRRNQLPVENVQFLGMDILKSFGRLKRNGPYDLIIIDPPSNQSGFQAERHYARIVRRLDEMLAPDGQILACLNAPHLDPDFLDELFEGWSCAQRLSRSDAYPERYPERSLKLHLYHRA